MGETGYLPYPYILDGTGRETCTINDCRIEPRNPAYEKAERRRGLSACVPVVGVTPRGYPGQTRGSALTPLSAYHFIYIIKAVQQWRPTVNSRARPGGRHDQSPGRRGNPPVVTLGRHVCLPLRQCLLIRKTV
jgi:hypothetical protein